MTIYNCINSLLIAAFFLTSSSSFAAGLTLNKDIELMRNCRKDLNTEACNKLGDSFVQRNQEVRAVIYYELACRLNSAKGCANTARYICQNKNSFFSKKVQTQHAASISSCKAGEAKACEKLAAFVNPTFRPTLLLSAEHMRNQACRSGLQSDCQQAATKLVETVVAAKTSDTKKAVDNCASYGATRCMNLASIARKEGRDEEADALFKIACLAGESIACEDNAEVVSSQKTHEIQLKNCQTNGATLCMGYADEATKQGDDERVIAFLEQACRQSLPQACVRAYDFHATHKDKDRALARLGDACKLGDKNSCTVFANQQLANSDNPGEALKMLEQSCKSGDGKSCYELAKQYKREGKLAEAEKYFSQSCKLGFGWNCDEAKLAH